MLLSKPSWRVAWHIDLTEDATVGQTVEALYSLRLDRSWATSENLCWMLVLTSPVPRGDFLALLGGFTHAVRHDTSYWPPYLSAFCQPGTECLQEKIKRSAAHSAILAPLRVLADGEMRAALESSRTPKGDGKFPTVVLG